MSKGTIKAREYFVACRQDRGILDSLIETAKYKGMTVEEVCHAIPYQLSEEQEKKLREMGYSV